MNRRARVCFSSVLSLASTVPALCVLAQAPTVGEDPRYCNPIPLVAMGNDGSPSGISLADVTAFKDGGSVYLFGTGGGAYVSEDMVNWRYEAVQGRVPVAAHVAKYNGAYWMSGNSSPLYRADSVLGPYEVAGPWTMADGKPFSGVSNGVAWNDSFDVDIFVDDDNQPYLYYAGRSSDGVYGVPLDPDEPWKFTAEPKRLLTYNPDHVWERYGDRNEYLAGTWIEGPFMIKRNGAYYLQYTAPGTQWLSYAIGAYTGKSPLGPFTYAENSPLFRSVTGVVTGTGHGSLVEGPDGNWWQFYTIVMAGPTGGRRIGMDPVGFDENGVMVARGPTSTPQWAPGVVDDPVADGDSGSIAVSVNKVQVYRGQGGASSQRPGRDGAYAVDDHNGTYWQPAADDARPTLTVDLAPATEFDPPDRFLVDSCRIEFLAGGGGGGGGFRRFGGPPPASDEAGADSPAHQYRVEVSDDGESYTTVLDKTANEAIRYVEFDEIPPVECRFVRLTLTGWPHRVGVPLGVIEFTVFGKAVDPNGP